MEIRKRFFKNIAVLYIAHNINIDSAALIEETGLDLAEELPELIDAIGRGVLALEAIVDGVITRQVTLDGTGAAAIPEVRGRPAEMLLRSDLDFDIKARGAIEETVKDLEPIDGFMAVFCF